CGRNPSKINGDSTLPEGQVVQLKDGDTITLVTNKYPVRFRIRDSNPPPRPPTTPPTAQTVTENKGHGDLILSAPAPLEVPARTAEPEDAKAEDQPSRWTDDEGDADGDDNNDRDNSAAWRNPAANVRRARLLWEEFSDESSDIGSGLDESDADAGKPPPPAAPSSPLAQASGTGPTGLSAPTGDEGFPDADSTDAQLGQDGSVRSGRKRAAGRARRAPSRQGSSVAGEGQTAVSRPRRAASAASAAPAISGEERRRLVEGRREHLREARARRAAARNGTLPDDTDDGAALEVRVVSSGSGAECFADVPVKSEGPETAFVHGVEVEEEESSEEERLQPRRKRRNVAPSVRARSSRGIVKMETLMEEASGI
ncbi:hypothetical protein HK405_009443, partial [Cladochytrium tenue]